MIHVYYVLLLLAQNAKGSVEVAAKCFYRRKDLPLNVLAAADTHASQSILMQWMYDIGFINLPLY